MPVILDTYNVLHVVGVLPPDLAGIDTGGLVELIRASRFRHERVILVCDGPPAEDAPTGRIGPVTVRYSGPGRTADDVIGQMVRRSSTPRRLTVVSSDRAVLREARRRRCRTLGSEDFLRQIAADHEDRTRGPGPPPDRPPPPAGAEVEDWVAAFAIGEEDLVEPALLDPAPPEPGPPPVPEPAGPDPADRLPDGASPFEAFLPPDLLAEAEALAAAGSEEDTPPPIPPPPEHRAEAREPAAAAAGDDAPPPEDVPDAAPGPPSPPGLPDALVAAAEALLAAAGEEAAAEPDLETGRGAPAPTPPPETADEPTSDLAGLEALAREEPADDILPRGILDEAESLWDDDDDDV